MDDSKHGILVVVSVSGLILSLFAAYLVARSVTVTTSEPVVELPAGLTWTDELTGIPREIPLTGPVPGRVFVGPFPDVAEGVCGAFAFPATALVDAAGNRGGEITEGAWYCVAQPGTPIPVPPTPTRTPAPTGWIHPVTGEIVAPGPITLVHSDVKRSQGFFLDDVWVGDAVCNGATCYRDLTPGGKVISVGIGTHRARSNYSISGVTIQDVVYFEGKEVTPTWTSGSTPRNTPEPTSPSATASPSMTPTSSTSPTSSPTPLYGGWKTVTRTWTSEAWMRSVGLPKLRSEGWEIVGIGKDGGIWWAVGMRKEAR